MFETLKQVSCQIKYHRRKHIIKKIDSTMLTSHLKRHNESIYLYIYFFLFFLSICLSYVYISISDLFPQGRLSLLVQFWVTVTEQELQFSPVYMPYFSSMQYVLVQHVICNVQRILTTPCCLPLLLFFSQTEHVKGFHVQQVMYVLADSSNFLGMSPLTPRCTSWIHPSSPTHLALPSGSTYGQWSMTDMRASHSLGLLWH